MKKRYKTGIVIGRFQPFHLGHKYLIEKALEISESIIIGIGSSNIKDDKNPYTFYLRKRFLNEFIHQEGIEKRIVKIISIPDHPDDDIWLKNLLKKSGNFDVSIGDNEWVNGIFENAQIPVVRTGFYKRRTLEGTKIRKLIKDDKFWQKRIPEYLVKYIK